jgi:putative inorganic carbon (HCO3(-)) transporter
MVKIIRLHWQYIAMLFIALIFAYALYSEKSNLLIGLEVSIIIGLFAVLLFTDKNLVVQFIILMAPLSISLSLPGASKLSFPTEMGSFILIFFVGFLLLLKDKTDWKFLRHPITILLLADLLIHSYATVLSTMPVISIKRLFLRFVFVLAYFFIFYEWYKKDKKLNRIFILYAIGFILPIFYTLMKHSNYGFSQPTSYIMSQPFYKDHTIYGACLAFILPFLIFWLVNSWKHISGLIKTGMSALLVLLFIAFILSYSRASWISFLLVLVFTFLLRYKIKIYHLIGLLLITGTIAFFSFNKLYELARQEDLKTSNNIGKHLSNVGNLDNDASNLERINRWVCALRMFQEKPLTGFGPGTYQFQYGSFQSANFMTRISTYHGNKGNAHSEYLSPLAETGILGFIQFVIFVFYSIHLGLKLYYRHSDNPKLKVTIYGAMAGLCTFFVHGFFNSFLDYEKMAILVYGSLALLVYIDVNYKEEEFRTG